MSPPNDLCSLLNDESIHNGSEVEKFGRSVPSKICRSESVTSVGSPVSDSRQTVLSLRKVCSEADGAESEKGLYNDA